MGKLTCQGNVVNCEHYDGIEEHNKMEACAIQTSVDISIEIDLFDVVVECEVM